MKGLKYSVPSLRGLSMRALSIRARLLLLSSFMLSLLAGPDLVSRSRIVSEQATPAARAAAA